VKGGREVTEEASNDDRRWLTVAEAGALAGICRSAAYDAVNRGDIPSIRVGRLIRVPRRKWLSILDGEHLSPERGTTRQ
jgi:excisionase family DNA binding protein